MVLLFSWIRASVGGRLLARNALINIAGQGAPLLAALVTFPFLIAGLGEAKFGALTLIWVLIGYASIFDFGLGRALTQLLARKVAENERDQLRPLTWTALSVMLATGTVAALAMFLGAPSIVERLLDLGGNLATETKRALRLLAVFLPVVILTTGVRGILETFQRFGTINAIRVPVALLNYLGPLAVLPFSRDLTAVVAVLAVIRSGETLAYWAAARAIPDVTGPFAVRRDHLRELLSFGSWMTVSNVIAPIMLSFDRFFIANMLSLTAVAYYTTPYTLVTKLRIVPSGLMAVLFPEFSQRAAVAPERLRQLYRRATLALLGLLGPVVLALVVLARPLLTLWLGEAFAEQSYRVAQLLALGVLVHALGQVPFTFLQASGRPDLTAKLHLIEVPFYIGYLMLLIGRFGIVGAAGAWLVRVLLSTTALSVLAARELARADRAPPAERAWSE